MLKLFVVGIGRRKYCFIHKISSLSISDRNHAHLKLVGMICDCMCLKRTYSYQESIFFFVSTPRARHGD